MTKRENDILWTKLPPGPSLIPAFKVLAPIALLALGAAAIIALPATSDEPQKVSAVASAPQPQPGAAVDESFCDKQAWPYVDQRCAQQIDAARGTRQVRIVTDKGQSVKTVTPLPVVEPKQPAKPQPTVAQSDRPLGPPVAPPPANEPPPQLTAAAPAKPEPATTASVQAAVPASPAPAAAKAMASANVPPAAASNEPVAQGSEALDDTRPKSKSARKSESAERRALEKAQKREAKRMRRIEQETGSPPQEVVDAARDEERNAVRPRAKKRVRNGGVPDEVIAAVEAATARDREVTFESSRGRRVIVVPRDGGW